jgi:hypothetical protein
LNVKKKEKKKSVRWHDLNPQPLDKKSVTLPQDFRDLNVNESQESFFTAIFITNVKIRTSGCCSIFRHNKHYDF